MNQTESSENAKEQQARRRPYSKCYRDQDRLDGKPALSALKRVE